MIYIVKLTFTRGGKKRRAYRGESGVCENSMKIFAAEEAMRRAAPTRLIYAARLIWVIALSSAFAYSHNRRGERTFLCSRSRSFVCRTGKAKKVIRETHRSKKLDRLDLFYLIDCRFNESLDLWLLF
jgi:hypothetical protein